MGPPLTSHPSVVEGKPSGIGDCPASPCHPGVPTHPQAPAEPSKGTALRWHLSGELWARARRGSRVLWDGLSSPRIAHWDFSRLCSCLFRAAPLLQCPPLLSCRLCNRFPDGYCRVGFFAGCSSCSRLSCHRDFPIFLRTRDSIRCRGIASAPPAHGAGGAQPLPLAEQCEAGKIKEVEEPPGFPVMLMTFSRAFGSSAAILESESSEEDEEEEEESATVQVSLAGSFSVLLPPPARATLR